MELGIHVEVEILEEISHVQMDIIDLARILGIFLDNAIEAALEAEQPKLQFAAICSENKKVFIIANTFVDKGIPIATLKKEGVSTKGENRGIGLFHVKKVVSGYQNVMGYGSETRLFHANINNNGNCLRIEQPLRQEE